jgi:hypothetical protein
MVLPRKNLINMSAKKNITDKVGNVGMPISFEQFSKDPVKGLLFIVLIAIGYLYVDGKMNYQGQITKHEEKIVVLEGKVDLLTSALKRSDSCLAVAVTKLEILTQMNDK